MATALKDIPFKSEFPTINERGAFVDLKIGTPCDCGVYAEMTYCDGYTPFGCGVLEMYNSYGSPAAVHYAMCSYWTCYSDCASYANYADGTHWADCACWASYAEGACWADCACWASYAEGANCACWANDSENARYLLCNCGCGSATTISYCDLTSNP